MEIKNRKRLLRVVLGCVGLGLGSMIILLVLLDILLGGKQASDIIFGYSPAIFIFGLGALWFPFINRRME